MRKSPLFYVFFSVLLVSASLNAADPFKSLSKKMAKKISFLKNPKVGILAFPYHDGRVSSGSSIVSEKLTTHMASMKNVRIIERRLISKLLEEQHVNETGAIDPATAQQMGKILNIDVMITGTLIDLDNGKTEVNARALKTDTGEIIVAEAANIERTWKDAPHFPRPPRPRESVGDRESQEDEKSKKDDNEPIQVGYPRGGGRSWGRFGGR